jgi:hypothetical protein
MAQFFYGGNIAYDEGANVRNLADALNKSQQTAALSRQADAASKESLTKSVADLTALMADPTFQATAAQNPQLAKAIVDRSLDVAGLKNGFLGDLWAKLSGGATNDDMTRVALKNYFDSISATAQNNMAYNSIVRDNYEGQGNASPSSPPNNNNPNQSAASTTNVNNPAGTPPVASQPNRGTTSSDAEVLGKQLLQASQGTPVATQTPATPTAPASQGTTAPSLNGYPRDTNYEVPVTLNNDLRSGLVAPASSAVKTSPGSGALAGTGAPSPSASGQNPLSQQQVRDILDNQAAQQKVDLTNAQALPGSMLSDYASWYSTTYNKGQPVRDPTKLATGNPTLVAKYLASKGYSADQITGLIQATLSGQTASSASQASAQTPKQPAPAASPTSPTSQAAPQQDTATQGTPNSFPTYADRQLTNKIGTYSPKLDAVFNSPAGQKVMTNISTTGAVDLSNPQTHAVLQKTSYLAVPAIVQNIRNLPPEELQRRWQDAMAFAQNMSLDAAVASGDNDLTKAKQLDLTAKTQEDIARLAYYGDLTRLAAAQSAQTNDPEAGRLKAISEMVTGASKNSTEIMNEISTAAKASGLSLAAYFANYPNEKKRYDDAVRMASAATAGFEQLMKTYTNVTGSVISTEPGKVGASAFFSLLSAPNAMVQNQPEVPGLPNLSPHAQAVLDKYKMQSKK